MKKRLSLSRIFKQRDKLFQAIKPYVQLNITAGTFRDFVDDVYRVLPNYVSRDAVFETCRTLIGQPLDQKTAAEFAWRVAGNVDLLLNSRPILPWSRQLDDEWVPVQVIRVDPAIRKDKPGHLFYCRALAGSYCPGVFTQFFSRASCAAIARMVGFSKTRPYTNPLYFTNLRFWAFVEAARSIESPRFQQVECATGMLMHNQKIIAVRTRAALCPQNFEHPCDRCVVGQDSCFAAIFAKQLVKQPCPRCCTDTYFDLTRSEEICVVCWRAIQSAKIAGH
jgi:hypothetical protein